MSATRIYPVILAGGSGTRFWPLSRSAKPKQLLKLGGDKTLIEQTAQRAAALAGAAQPYVVAGASLAELIRAALGERASYIVEPAARNTAPALLLAALELKRLHGPDAVMAAMPADHAVADVPAFCAALEKAAAHAADHDALVVLGITPDRPATGYGYIKAGGDGDVRPVDRFVEKPPLRDAEKYLVEGGYFWNAGLFIWRVGIFLEELQTNMPHWSEPIGELRTAMAAADDAAVARIFNGLESISIDYALMEKTGAAALVPVACGWDDLGSWESLERGGVGSDAEGNRTAAGRLLALESGDNIVHAAGRLVALKGVNDMVVVVTDDAVLVCPKDDAEGVKELVALLAEQGLDTYL